MKRTTPIGIAVAVVAGVAILNEIVGVVAAYWPWLAMLGLLTLTIAGGIRRRRRAGSAATVQAWSARRRRHHGVASALDIARTAGAATVRRKGTDVRPSLGVIAWDTPTTEVAINVCRVGALTVWSSLEKCVTVFGAPRRGKTWWMARTIINAPGAVVTTSTRLDLWKLTAPRRSTGGRPVYVFNPGGLGQGFGSTIAFNPLHGCDTPMIAVERATDMIPDAGGVEGERWDKKGRRNLAMLLHAAAISGRSSTDVARWVADIPRSGPEILSALRRSPEPAFLAIAKGLIALNERTQTSILDAIAPAFSWLIDPNAAAAAHGDCQLDIETLLRERGTVYLLGREEGHTAPLLSALTGYIARTARRLAEKCGGRLDPPLMLALDEAARIAPVPLPDWSGDFGGAGLCIVSAFQSRADAITRWGEHETSRILTNSGTVVVFGGGNDNDEHEAWSKRTGERDEPAHPETSKTRPDAGKSPPRRAPVLSATQIAELPSRRVVVFCEGISTVVGTVKMNKKFFRVRRPVNQPVRVVEPVVAPVPVTAERVADVVDIDRARSNSVA